ncbi:hypothetical protein [Marinobacter sp. CHS3-4]|uniref:hypothetical protein n=1 Tax=Marinobacter sp. CHS3-4 TaxID=3045174 RepID=UPI0024B5ED0E|nr:hypothetical protein [Marinobacter sp. CHS3-4]MDI9244631.1 hypothetical protein [Marinobacter sp. CHS3-4]
MNMKMMAAVALYAALGAASLGTTAAAHPPKPGTHHKPPEAALEACKGHKEGDSVSFETPKGDTLEASCKKISGKLAAVPVNHHKKHGNPH